MALTESAAARVSFLNAPGLRSDLSCSSGGKRALAINCLLCVIQAHREAHVPAPSDACLCPFVPLSLGLDWAQPYIDAGHTQSEAHQSGVLHMQPRSASISRPHLEREGQKEAAIQLWDAWARDALGDAITAPMARKKEQEKRQRELDRLERQCHQLTERARGRVEASYQISASSAARGMLRPNPAAIVDVYWLAILCELPPPPRVACDG